jgi:bifunctional non-homologous end joining protein LigD
MAAREGSLATYNAKRDFARTREPRGDVAAREGHRFVVQKHAATRLHWDLRLEMDGVFKSWAVTRGPSPDPDDKRLAVRTEDHPISYGDFEGTIPKGEYGGGTVMLWDKGSWRPVPGKSASDLEKGHLHFILEGERMKGEWLLVRMKPRPGEKHENWLLRKVEDDAAGSGDRLVEEGLTSVVTGRSMDDIAKGKPGRRKATTGAKAKGALPKFRKPQLATLVDHVPSGSGWIHEVKYDGYRCILAIGGGEARAYTRTGLDWSDRFAEIVAEARTIPAGSALIDGEIVWLDKAGRPSFSGLQDSLKHGRGGLVLFVFDLLEQDGADLAGLPNVVRKERLHALIGQRKGAIQYAEHITGAGEKLFAAMCKQGYEGIVSKRADARYTSRRTTNWLKVKCTNRSEFVIIGWTQSSSRTRSLRSLLLAVNEAGGLRYAGRVGTGFGGETLKDLHERLAPLARETPVAEIPKGVGKANWVEPELVAEVAFAEFTDQGVVRHASFIGLREDKPAEEVTPEVQQPVEDEAPPSKIAISNRDRVIFPETGITKGELADYYLRMAPLLLPWLAQRPISLVRCPQGRAKKCFFQKHDAGSFGAAVHHVDIREKDGSSEPYLYVIDSDGVLACVQMGTIEFHGWGSHADRLEHPDRLVFDLDPDEGLGFGHVIKAAVEIKGHLAEMGLVSFPLLSGGKGVHVVVPLRPMAHWPEVKDFAQRFAAAMAQAEPDRFTATMSKAKRKGRIFIDWLRNQRGSTAIMPYSVRARPGAPVAAPVAWSELDTIKKADSFTMRDHALLQERARGRLLSGWGISDQTLPDI